MSREKLEGATKGHTLSVSEDFLSLLVDHLMFCQQEEFDEVISTKLLSWLEELNEGQNNGY
jgi:hypothetical protein